MNKTQDNGTALQTKLSDLHSDLWDLGDLATESGQQDIAFFLAGMQFMLESYLRALEELDVVPDASTGTRRAF